MSEQRTLAPSESRWPAIVAILVVLTILEFLPGRLRVAPVWFPYLTAILLLAPMLGAALTHSTALAWVERVDIYLFVLVAVVLMIWTLARLIHAVVSPTAEMGGIRLFASGIALWVINIIAFALLYWEVDRGGPDLRASRHERPPDILFPDIPSEMSRPLAFMDYLFFAYTTSTAFTPTETYPITARMKALMMIQGTISLALIVVVAARAINVLK
ncbi:MAG: hypothetical protein ACXWNK_10870 [Vulcanimicrobiaceae bacterium]